MEPERFRAFTAAVSARLQREPGVRGLVALGSTADLERGPDAASDHDLWVVTVDGGQEPLRSSQAWLPEPERIVLAFRETEHGVKIVYDDAHLVEYAVFSLDELAVARAHEHRVLFGDPEVKARVADTARPERRPSPPDLPWLFGQALTHLLVGMARHRRGERMSAHVFVRGMAVERVITLIRILEPPAPGSSPDPLDPFRRFEQTHPVRAATLDRALETPLPELASVLLGVLRELASGRGELSTRAIEAVELALVRVAGS